MVNQRVMQNPLTPVLWDYHVILLVLSEKNQIVDFAICCYRHLFIQSFLDNALLDADTTPLFRLVPASEFVAVFCSDRSHMKTEEGWLTPPPAWPLIGTGSNLTPFTDMTDHEFGEVLTYDAVLERFS